MIKRKSIYFLLASSLVSFQMFAGFSSAAGLYDGEWKGESNQGYEVTFTVDDDQVTDFYLFVSDSSIGMTCYSSVQGSANFSGNSFFITGGNGATGEFSSRRTCTGTWAMSSNCGFNSGTWEATNTSLTGPAISSSPSDLCFLSLESIDSFELPPGHYIVTLYVPYYASDLTFDGTNIWAIDVNDDEITKFDNDGNVIETLDVDSINGLTFDGYNLWYSDNSDDKLCQIDLSGTEISSVNSPTESPGSMTFDGTYLWLVDNADDKILQIDTSGSIISSIDAPAEGIDGLAFDGTYLWVTKNDPDDNTKDKIYMLDTTGTVIQSFNSMGNNPQGIVFDGTYLWLADPSEGEVYKLEIPSPTEVGDSAIKTITITNEGTEDLAIDTISITGTHSSEFAIQNDGCSNATIAPLGSGSFEIVFTPTSGGNKSAGIEVPSNDTVIPILSIPIFATASGPAIAPDDGGAGGNGDGGGGNGDGGGGGGCFIITVTYKN
jgi:hypothetical protein